MTKLHPLPFTVKSIFTRRNILLLVLAVAMFPQILSLTEGLSLKQVGASAKVLGGAPKILRSLFPTNKAASPQSEQVHILSLPYYITKEGWESTLTLNNTLRTPLSVSIKLYSLDGAPLSLPDQALRPHQNVSLRLSELLTQFDHSGRFKEGSIELSFQNEIGMALGPQLTIANLAKGLSIDIEPPMGHRSNKLEGIWWSLDDETDAQVILSNTKSQPLNVQMSIDWKGEQILVPPVLLRPRQTVVMDIAEILKSLDLSKKAIGSGGLSLSHKSFNTG